MARLVKHTIIVLMMAIAFASCKDPSAGGSGNSFSNTSEFKSAVERATLTSLVSNAFFAPFGGVAAAGSGGEIKTTLYLYVHSLPEGPELMKLQMQGSDGSNWTIAISGSTTAPGWLSVDMDLISSVNGTVTYTIWLVMNDFSVSNKLYASFGFGIGPGVGSTTKISNLVFDPDPTVAKTSAEAVTDNVSIVTVTVNLFIHTVTQGDSLVSLMLSGQDGTSRLFPITTAPTVPGWLSQDVEFTYKGVEGNYIFTAWLVLDDGSQSNRLTDSLRILSDQESGTRTVISSANFDPTTADAVYEDINNVDVIVSYKSTLSIYIHTITTDTQIMSLRLTGTDNTDKTFSVASNPTIPGWYSTEVTWDVAEYPGAGTETYTVWLEMADSTNSNSDDTDMRWP